MHINFPVYPHHGTVLCMRAVCMSAAMATVCQEASIASHPNQFSKTTLYEMSTESFYHNKINTLVSSKNIGSKLSLVHSTEADFVPLNTNLVGVILGEYERKITWYLMQKPELPVLPSNDDPECIKEVESAEGVGIFHKTILQENMKYYICAFSNTTVVTREYFSETLEEIKECGNGFVVDNEPPIAGRVTIVSKPHGFLTSNRDLHVLWEGFKDIEVFVKNQYETGIAYYNVSLGICVIIYYSRRDYFCFIFEISTINYLVKDP